MTIKRRKTETDDNFTDEDWRAASRTGEERRRGTVWPTGFRRNEKEGKERKRKKRWRRLGKREKEKKKKKIKDVI